MEAFDDDRLLAILILAGDVALEKKTKNDLASELQDFDLHLRERYVDHLVRLFTKGVAQRMDIDSFVKLTEADFPEQPHLLRALRAFWRRNGESMKQEFWQLHPFDSHLMGVKWVSTVPSGSKFGLQSAQPSVQCQFKTTDIEFNLDFSANALNQLAASLAEIQSAIPK